MFTACDHSLMMEAASTPEAPLNFYQTKLHNIPQEIIFEIILSPHYVFTSHALSGAFI
jgi:hypothetical protein